MYSTNQTKFALSNFQSKGPWLDTNASLLTSRPLFNKRFIKGEGMNKHQGFKVLDTMNFIWPHFGKVHDKYWEDRRSNLKEISDNLEYTYTMYTSDGFGWELRLNLEEMTHRQVEYRHCHTSNIAQHKEKDKYYAYENTKGDWIDIWYISENKLWIPSG